MILLLLALATLAVTDTAQRLAPWPLPRPLIRVATVALGLAGAHHWGSRPWVLLGLGSAGLAILVPQVVNGLAGAVQVVPAGARGPAVTRPRRVPDLP